MRPSSSAHVRSASSLLPVSSSSTPRTESTRARASRISRTWAALAWPLAFALCGFGRGFGSVRGSSGWGADCGSGAGSGWGCALHWSPLFH